MRPLFFAEDTAGDLKDDDHMTTTDDDDEDDENRSNDDDIGDFDEDNDSKSEVDHRKKVNEEPQKERALDTSEEGSPKKKVCSEFIYIPTNQECSTTNFSNKVYFRFRTTNWHL